MSLSLGMTESVASAVKGDILISNREYRQVDVTLKSGTSFLRGDMLGKITASGKYTVWDNRESGAATDGSQTFVGILLQDTNATSTDEKASIAVSGEFNVAFLRAVDTVVVGNYNNIGTILIKAGV